MYDQDAELSFIENPDETHKRDLIKRRKIDKIIQKQRTFKQFFKQFEVNFRSAWKVLLSLWLCFTVTFSLLPGVFLKSHFNFMSKFGKGEFTWYQMMVILSFNILDTIGRRMGSILRVPAPVVYLVALLRVAFVFTSIWIVTSEPSANSTYSASIF